MLDSGKQPFLPGIPICHFLQFLLICKIPFGMGSGCSLRAQSRLMVTGMGQLGTLREHPYGHSTSGACASGQVCGTVETGVGGKRIATSTFIGIYTLPYWINQWTIRSMARTRCFRGTSEWPVMK